MKTHMMMAAMLLTAQTFAEGDLYTDADIAGRLADVGGSYYCGLGMQRRELEWTLANMCGYDSNRLVRIAKEVARSHPDSAETMIGLVGRYGGADDLPFLHGYLANDNVGRVAAKSILRIEGLTTNSIAAVGVFLMTTNAEHAWSHVLAADRLLGESGAPQVPDDIRAFARNILAKYAKIETNYVMSVDRRFNNYLPFYRFSTNRLEVMRSVLSKDLYPGVDNVQLNYVTNAIHELERALEAQGQNE